MSKPFDGEFMEAMVEAAKITAHEAQGFKLGYVQSDEVTLCLSDYETLETQPWFGYDLFKIVSVSASIMTEAFSCVYPDKRKLLQFHPVFDSRAFSIPEDEIANMFLWRAKDWERNSLTMYCGHFFSHKEMHGQGRADQHEMLHSVGKNWTTDLSDRERNGTFILHDQDGVITDRSNIEPRYVPISEIIDHSGLHIRE
jgi:tRNA(His) 5'-end guanylyltransferase